MARTVFVNAGPWLPVPPSGYGGVETMLAYLIPELRRRGLRERVTRELTPEERVKYLREGDGAADVAQAPEIISL